MIRGIFAAHSGIIGDRVGDFSSRVLKTIEQGSTPMLALSSGMPKKKATDTGFSWIEQEHITGATTAAETVNSAATDFDVADPNLWTPNTIITNVNSGEYMLVTAISGVNVTVVRGLCGTTAATVTSGHVLHNVGTAFGEGSGKPTSIAQRGASRTNYVQIFKNGWSITGTAVAIQFLTGSQMAENKTQCAAFHAEDIEKAFLFGRKGSTTVSGQRVYLSDGLFAQVEQYGGLVEDANYGAQAGEMSIEGLLDFLRRIFDVNVVGAKNERIAFTSSLTLQRINAMARMDSTYNITQGQEKEAFGIQVTTITGLNGTLKLMSHPMFGMLSKNAILVLHPAFIVKRELRPMSGEEFNAQKQNNNGNDSVEGYVMSHLGFEAGATRTMGILDAITTPVPSFA